MKRKYLDDLGVTERPDLWNKDDKRNPQWEKEREIYGFDERETWDLGQTTFYCWLYERLKRYIEIAPVSLNYHKFGYKDKGYTQGELINMMIEKLEFYFSSEYNDFNFEHWEKVHEVEQIWAIVLPSMWW